MKHNWNITAIMLLLFLISQFIGLIVVDRSVDVEKTKETGKTTFKQLPYNIERPAVRESTSFLYIMLAILVGTGIVFLIIKFKQVNLWKVWFFLSVALSLGIAFSAFMNSIIAAVLAIVLAVVKIFRPNVYVHNFTEVFIYAGIAAVFVPIMNFLSVFLLLIAISAYDAYAVWKSKHMIKLAKFQTKSKIFAGILLPYKIRKQGEKEIKSFGLKKGLVKAEKIVKKKGKVAILGGGDIAFPLLFAGVVLKTQGFLKSLIIPVFVTLALFILLYLAKKDKFYPAMPFLTAGCLIGYGVVLLVNWIL